MVGISAWYVDKIEWVINVKIVVCVSSCERFVAVLISKALRFGVPKRNFTTSYYEQCKLIREIISAKQQHYHQKNAESTLRLNDYPPSASPKYKIKEVYLKGFVKEE